MRDKIDFLVEETGASNEEAELALGLANFDIEEALKILQANRRDILVLKVKFYNPNPRLYGLMLLISNVSEFKKNPIFRLRFVSGDNPHLYETPLAAEWYEFEKEIYRARLSEWSYIALSQSIEKEWEKLVASSSDVLHQIRESVEKQDRAAVGRWLEGLMENSMVLTPQAKFNWEGEVLSLRDFRQTPRGIEGLLAQTRPSGRRANGDIFMKLRVALADRITEISTAPTRQRPVSELRPGDTVFVYVLETRDSAVYMTELFGGLQEGNLSPIEVPVESVWEEGGLTGVRVRFGHAVVGEGTYPKELRIASLTQN